MRLIEKIQELIKSIKMTFYSYIVVNEKRLTFTYKGVVIELIDNMSEETEKGKNKFILKFNEYVELHKDEDFWMTPEQISGATGTTITETVNYVESFDEFVKNSKDKYTIRDLYKKNTPFLKRFLDAYNSNID